jgi:Domain of unknown function (DUF2935)
MEFDTTRRDVLKAGGLLVLGTAAGGCATATGLNRAVPPLAKVVQDSSQTRTTSAAAGASMPTSGVEPEDKPTFVPDARDPVAYSRADNLFWNDIMMEHAIFFQMLMPGPELDAPRRQAQEFQRLFASQLQLASEIDAGNYASFNQRSIDLAKRFSDYKKQMREQQATAKMRSLVWPLFFEHTAREADRFAARLALYSKRQIEFDRAEVIDFWSKTMGEHSGFIANLLDPSEKLLHDQAHKMQKAFLETGFKQVRGDEVTKAAQEILDFKTVGEKGIKSGKIKSIIHPSLASHVRREAVKFIDELKRV